MRNRVSENKKKEFLVTNIQRMCFHDGPGVRTTVFFKGCNLHCPWCANPENISMIEQEYAFDGGRGVYGISYTQSELYQELIKDKVFYEPDGGVTFSGGEPLLHISETEELLRDLSREEVHIAVETALQVQYSNWESVIDYIDFFIIDVKILDEKLCSEVLGGNVSCFFECIEKIYPRKKMLFRFPLNKKYTLSDKNLELVIEFLKKYSDVPVEIFATHSLGKQKYESLGLMCEEYEKISDDEIKDVEKRIKDVGCEVRIIRL